VRSAPPTNISATIVADVKRFSPQINTDEVFGTHRAVGESVLRGSPAPTLRATDVTERDFESELLRSLRHLNPVVAQR
jgi:hypothetical protein